MLGLENPIHLAFLLVLLLLVFGAKRLPEMGRSMGAGLRGFKEAVTGEDGRALTVAASAAAADEHAEETTVAPDAGGEAVAIAPAGTVERIVQAPAGTVERIVPAPTGERTPAAA